MESYSDWPSEFKNTPMLGESKLDWHGLHSKKWNHPQRLHLRANDQLGDKIVGRDPPVLGRKHFSPIYSGTYGYKSCVRLFPRQANRESKLGEFSFKKIAYVPPQRRYGQNEKFQCNPKHVEHNLHPASSFTSLRGSNDEKNGTCHINNPTNNRKGIRIIYGKGTWKEREARETKHEDEKAVRDLGEWERKTLKTPSRQQTNVERILSGASGRRGYSRGNDNWRKSPI